MVAYRLPAPSLAEAASQELVLVDCGAPLLLRPSAGATTLELPAGACDYDWHPSGVWPARLIRFHDGFAELRSLGRADEDSCTDQPPGFSTYRLRVFVPEERLIRTVDRPTVLAGARGVRVQAVPGTPLWPLDSRTAEVEVQGIRVQVRIDETDRVRRYRAWRISWPGDGLDELPARSEIRWLSDDRGEPAPIWTERITGPRRVVSLFSGCTRLEMPVTSDEVHIGLPDSPGGAPDDEELRLPRQHLRLRDGAEVFLPTGESVGTRSAGLFRFREVYWVGDRACVEDELPVREGLTGSSTACFEGEDLSD